MAPSPARTPSVIRGGVRRFVALACAIAALFGLVGCGSNFNAQTQQPYQPAVGISDRSGQVYSINTLIVTDGHGNGTVVSALINQADTQDTLQSVTAVDDQGGGMQVQPLPEGGISLTARHLVQLASDGSVRLKSDNLEAGRFVSLTFTFANAAPVKIDVPVVAQTSTYADVPVGGST